MSLCYESVQVGLFKPTGWTCRGYRHDQCVLIYITSLFSPVGLNLVYLLTAQCSMIQTYPKKNLANLLHFESWYRSFIQNNVRFVIQLLIVNIYEEVISENSGSLWVFYEPCDKPCCFLNKIWITFRNLGESRVFGFKSKQYTWQMQCNTQITPFFLNAHCATNIMFADLACLHPKWLSCLFY